LTEHSQHGPRAGGERPGAAAQVSTEEAERAIALTPLMARLDVAVAAALALIGAALTVAMPRLIASSTIDTARDFATLSPALIPRMAFGLLAVLAVIAAVMALQAAREGGGRPRAEEPGRLRRAGIAALIAVAYAASVTTLGYILATMLMTAVMSFYLGLRNPLLFIPGVIVVPVAIKFIFERLLLISLPRSSIEGIGVVEDAVLRVLTQMFIP
jgi:hypothetical protein